MSEFRPVPDDDLEAFRSLVRYAFSPQEGPIEEFDPDEIPVGMEVGRRYGLYDGDDLQTVCKHISFSARVRGEFHDLDGLSAVASPPELRRRGLVRELLQESLAQSRSDGVAFSALWPFKRSFYASYGWATASRALRHELDPDALSFAPGYDGEFVELDGDDWERVDAVHEVHGEPYALTVDRTEEWWRKRVFAGWKSDPYAYGFERDGDLAAYVTYGFDENGDGRTLQVRDWAYVDHDARLAVLRFLADHDSQVEEVQFWAPPCEDVLDLLPDDEGVTVELSRGPMFRLVDVPAALEALSLPEDATCDVVLDVDDPLADWNDDAFAVHVADGSVSVERVDAEADATLGVGALSQLVAGYRSARELATVGEIDGIRDAVAALGEAFPPRGTFLREGF